MFSWLKKLYLATFCIGILGFGDGEEDNDAEGGNESEGSEEGGNEDNEGSNEESSDDESGDDSGEDSTSSSSNGKSSNSALLKFFDVKTLPKEMQPLAKELQGKFTKRMQKELEKYKKNSAYAEGFKTLMKNKDFLSWWDTYRSGNKSGNKKQASDNGNGDKGSNAEIKAMLEEMLESKLGPIQSFFATSHAEKVEQSKKQQLEGLSKILPGYSNFEDGAEEISESYGGHIRQDHAIMLAAFPELMELLNSHNLLNDKMNQKKKGSDKRPTGNNKGFNDKKKSGPIDFEEAYDRAERELARKS